MALKIYIWQKLKISKSTYLITNLKSNNKLHNEMIKKLLLIKNAKQITDTPGFKPLPYIDLNADLHYERECGYPMSVT